MSFDQKHIAINPANDSPGGHTLNPTSDLVVTVTPQPQSEGGMERTLTGIPITVIWMPYVGFSAVLVVLVALSFLQYHRKHGHKYHNSPSDYDCTDATSPNPPQAITGNDSASTAPKSALSRNDARPSGAKQPGDNYGRYKQNRKLSEADFRALRQQRSRESQERDPPNGGIHLSQQRTQGRHQYNPNRRSEDSESAYETLQHPKEPTDTGPRRSFGPSDRQISASSADYTARSQRHHNRGSTPSGGRYTQRGIQLGSKQADSSCATNTTSCDEPSTSSSTVSSKNSSNASKGSCVARGSHAPHPPRPRNRSVNYEVNQNGSMVDVRLDLSESVVTFKPARIKEQGSRGEQGSGSITSTQRRGLNRQVSHPTATEQSMGLFQPEPPDTAAIAALAAFDPHYQETPLLPPITDKMYRGTYVQASRFVSPGSTDVYPSGVPRDYQNPGRGSVIPCSQALDDYAYTTRDTQCGYNDAAMTGTGHYGNIDASAVWSTQPLQERLPDKKHYPHPFTPSGNMQMLSDTEDDEVLLLQHSKL